MSLSGAVLRNEGYQFTVDQELDRKGPTGKSRGAAYLSHLYFMSDPRWISNIKARLSPVLP
jgi:hypothetical protein